jgi:hypothetical protein
MAKWTVIFCRDNASSKIIIILNFDVNKINKTVVIGL